ncbi:MAG: hypothetical protein ACRC35_02860, partial [Angustibacter sp.]
MAFSFRIRGDVAPRVRLEVDAHEVVLLDNPPQRVVLRAWREGESIRDTRCYVILGSGYPDEAVAR